MGQPVVHFEVGAKDPKKAQDFYAKLFDWHVDANNPMNYGIVDTHAEGGINGGIGPTPWEKHVTFYVQVDDLQAHLNKAESLGGKAMMPPTSIPDGPTIAMFFDPEGNVIGLVSPQGMLPPSR
jgi:predicted enzyme related to lactoylglutathione lyase